METTQHHFSLTNDSRLPDSNPSPETLVQLEQDLKHVVDALALLGIRRCSHCRKFFRIADPGELFDYGELVCYACLPAWWTATSEQVSVVEREKLETKLSSWLRKYHNAEIVREDKTRASTATPYEFEVVVHCIECRGSGKVLEGERCRFCNGFGTVRVAVPAL